MRMNHATHTEKRPVKRPVQIRLAGVASRSALHIPRDSDM